MSNTDFNFSKAPFTNERLPRLCFLTATAIVLGITLVHGLLLARYLLREQEEMDIKVEALEQDLATTNQAIQQAQASLAQDQNAVRDERTRFLARLYRQKGFSWTGLFNELEEITPPPVRITSIAPTEERGQINVTLNIVGRTLQDVLEMVRRLEGSSFFATVFPVDESNLDEFGESGVAATLRLQYVEQVADNALVSSDSAETTEDLGTNDGAPDDGAREGASTPIEEIPTESGPDDTATTGEDDDPDPLDDDLDELNQMLDETEEGESEPGADPRPRPPRGDP